MTSLRRALYKRLATAAPAPRCTGGRVERDPFEEEAANALPSYSQVTERPRTPPPSYYSLSDPVTRPVHTPPMFSSAMLRRSVSNEQQIVDELVHRLRDIIKNPASWRSQENGQKTFFWALRCVPGTADVLFENAQEIKDRIVGSPNYQVEKFCFVFKGQKLVDLWCKPIQQEVFFLVLNCR